MTDAKFTPEQLKKIRDAAPELYEALEVCQSAMQTMLSPGAIHRTSAQHAFALLVDAEFRARAAIAKADGR